MTTDDMKLTDAQVHLLTHTMGLSERHQKPYRNHYVAGPNPADLLELVEMGLMEERRKPGFLPGDSRVFACTEAGRQRAIAENEARLPKLTRSEKRYRRYLDYADGVSISFGDWLRAGCP